MAWTRRGGWVQDDARCCENSTGKFVSATCEGGRANMSSHITVARRAPLTEPVPPTIIIPTLEADRDAWLRAVASDRRLRSGTRLIATALTLFEHDPTYDEIARAVGCSQRTAIRAMSALVTRGWIEKIASRGRVANQFRRTMRGPPGPPRKP
jgi:hypothetical protein